MFGAVHRDDLAAHGNGVPGQDLGQEALARSQLADGGKRPRPVEITGPVGGVEQDRAGIEGVEGIAQQHPLRVAYPGAGERHRRGQPVGQQILGVLGNHRRSRRAGQHGTEAGELGAGGPVEVVFGGAKCRLQGRRLAFQDVEAPVGEGDDGGGPKRRQRRVGLQPGPVLIDRFGGGGKTGGRPGRIPTRFLQLPDEVTFRPQGAAAGGVVVHPFDPQRPIDREGKLVVEVPQPLPRPIGEGPGGRGLRQTRERLIAHPEIGVLDGQVAPM